MPDVWSRFTRDPRDPALAAMRISDADRAVIADALGEAYAEGRLDRDEHDERVETSTTIKTFAQVPPLLVDLVIPDTSTSLATATRDDLVQRAERAYRTERRDVLVWWLGITAICFVIWFTTSLGEPVSESHPWFVYPALGLGLNAARVLMSHENIVEHEVARLERQQRKALKKRWRG